MSSKPVKLSDSDSWTKEYKRTRPYYEEFCSKLIALLEDLLSKAIIKYDVVEGRAKTIESFSHKLRRDGKTYGDPLREMTDLVGLRVIVYYEDDVDRVCSLLENEFEIDSRSACKEAILTPNRFGYLSVHEVFSLSNTRAHLPEWSDFSDFRAEVQVRTVLQHAWAAISHMLQYEKEKDIPSQLRRKLLRLSGLFELADEELLALREKQEVLRKEINERIEEKDLEIPINALTISEFLATSSLVKEAMEIVRHTKLEVEPRFDLGMSQLIAICDMIKVTKVRGLQERLISLRSKAKPFFEKLSALQTINGIAPSGSNAHWMAVLIVGGCCERFNMVEIKSRTGWSDNYVDRILESGKFCYDPN